MRYGPQGRSRTRRGLWSYQPERICPQQSQAFFLSGARDEPPARGGHQTHRPILDQDEIRETDRRLKAAFVWLGLTFQHHASFVGLLRSVKTSAAVALSGSPPHFLPTRIPEDPEIFACCGFFVPLCLCVSVFLQIRYGNPEMQYLGRELR